MPEIKDVLIDLNPWWKEPLPQTGYREREIYAEIGKFVPLPQIIALTGLRRVGKTTLLLKMVEDSIRGGTDPKSILYFSFDEFRETPIREVLKAYEAVANRSLRTGTFLVLLDEIQKLRDWQDQLKALYDAHKPRLKFVISGSESLFIRACSRETLAGRLFEFTVRPLTFREYLRFTGADYEPPSLYARELARSFEGFVLTQGFPELVGVADRSVVRKYLQESIIEKVVFRDIAAILGVKDVRALESILNVLMEEPGQLIELSGFASGLGISRKTLSTYLSYLEQSFLIRKLYNYSPSRRKVERKLRKFYPAMVSANLAFRDDAEARSRVFEWAMVTQTGAEFFWRDPYKNEVDIVLGGKIPIPLEINWGKADTSGLEAFMRKFKVRKGYVVTRETGGTKAVHGKTIVSIPASQLLLKLEGIIRPSR